MPLFCYYVAFLYNKKESKTTYRKYNRTDVHVILNRDLTIGRMGEGNV